MKALIAEDEFTNRMVLQKFLSHHGEVHACINGRECLDAFRAARDQGDPFDLICMDVFMPEMDGPTALAMIRSIEEDGATPAHERVKVIMTTGLGETDSTLDCIRSLYDKVLTKPVRMNRLNEILASLGFM